MTQTRTAAAVPPELALVYTPAQIASRVRAMARQLSRTFAGREPLVVGILKGAFIFVADLVRLMDIPVRVSFVQAASYGRATSSTGRVGLSHGPSQEFRDQDVILVDTVLDTGLTLDTVIGRLRQAGPRSLTVCVLVKKEGRTQREVPVDQVGFVRSQGFLVGYGTDWAERYRQLDGLYVLKEEKAQAP